MTSGMIAVTLIVIAFILWAKSELGQQGKGK